MTLSTRCLITLVVGVALPAVGCGTSGHATAPDGGGGDGGAMVGDGGAMSDRGAPLDDGGSGDSGAATDAEVVGPTVISASADSVREHEGNIAVAGDGRVAVTWLVEGPGVIGVDYRISLDRGATWGDAAALPVPSDNNIAANASLWARDDGTILVTWASETVGPAGTRSNVRVWMASSAPGETTFGSPALVTEPGSTLGVDLPDLIGLDDGSTLVTYTSYASPTGSSEVLAARSTDGTTWERTNATMGDGPGTYGFARTCAAGERAYLVYTDFATGIFLRSSDDGGATWTHPRLTVQAPAVTDYFPALGAGCVARGDEVWVMYARTMDYAIDQRTQQPLYSHIEVAHSPDRGATIDATYSVADPASGAAFLAPTMALGADGTLSVAYYAGTGDGDTAGSFRYALSRDGGRTFAPSTAIDTPLAFGRSRTSTVWPGDYVGLAIGVDNALYAAFCETGTSAAHVAFYRADAP